MGMKVIYLFLYLFLDFFFTETPRFYSERQDNKNKAKALCFFTIDDVNFSFKENDDDSNDYIKLIKNQNKYKFNNDIQKSSGIKVINYSYIRYKLSTDNRINKKFLVILFSYFIISYCFFCNFI